MSRFRSLLVEMRRSIGVGHAGADTCDHPGCETIRRVDAALAETDSEQALVEALTKERDEALAEVQRLQAEVRKQVFGSRVLFDREVVERAQLASDDPLEWPDWKQREERKKHFSICTFHDGGPCTCRKRRP